MSGPMIKVLGYEFFTTADGVELAYQVHGDQEKKPLILIHGFTGSSAVWSRNIGAFRSKYRVIVPDLRGHGRSGRRGDGHDHYVARLAQDLKELMDYLRIGEMGDDEQEADPSLPGMPSCIAGSLGCAIIWSFTEQFGNNTFDRLVLVDQSPLQNYTSDGTWGKSHGNRSLNSPEALVKMQAMLATKPEEVHRGTINACLAYLWDPAWGRRQFGSEAEYLKAAKDDTGFFLKIALQGDPTWLGKLMADHTAIDWRHSIKTNFGTGSGNSADTLVIASERSGCFPAAGPMWVVDATLEDENGENSGELYTQGVVIDFAGHWCYWENADKFNDLVLKFFSKPSLSE